LAGDVVCEDDVEEHDTDEGGQDDEVDIAVSGYIAMQSVQKETINRDHILFA
jgi:hypothetical protein